MKNKKQNIISSLIVSVLTIIFVPIFVIFGIPLLLMVFDGDNTGSVDNIPKYLNNKIGIDIKDCKAKENIEKYYFQDSNVYITLDCSNNSNYIVKQMSNWNRLPLSNILTTALYGGYEDENTYRAGILEDNEDYSIPVISNGYYYFVDKQNKESEKHSDKYLLNDERYSFNYYIAIYDIDTNKLYYIEME